MKTNYKDLHELTFFSGYSVKQIQKLSGSSFHSLYSVKTNEDTFFIKWSTNPYSAASLRSEAEGLLHLCSVIPQHIPEVLDHGPRESDYYIILPFIKTIQKNNESELAQILYQLHQTKNNHFGYISNNYIGTWPQVNKKSNRWASFFVQNRIVFNIEQNDTLIKYASDYQADFLNLCPKIEKIIEDGPQEASLLHGDFWYGNLLNSDQTSYLIDPAIYYGSYEVDLAMSNLFGGFSHQFYDVYYHYNKQEYGAELRQMCYQWYYLLIHLQLFGYSYLGQTIQLYEAIKRKLA